MNSLEEPDKAESSHKGRNIAATVVTTLFLGAIGSGIWEVMFRPGLSTMGGLLSFISSRFESEIYSTAALDPQPIPGLFVLLVLCIVPLLVATLFLFHGFLRKPVEAFLDRRIDGKLSKVKSKAARLNVLVRTLKTSYAVSTVVMFLLAMMTLVGFALQNQATMVWRTFHANLEICAPSASDSEIKRYRAQFRTMKSKADFERIKVELDRVAKAAGVTLNWYGV